MRRFLRKTGIRAKMTLILALMSLPYPILLVLLISQQNIAIHFAEKEELGAGYNLLLFQVYSAAEQNSLNPEKLQALDNLDASLGEELGTVDRWTTLRAQLNGDSSPQRRRAFLDLNTRVGDISNLILDPDLDSYYMMDITTIRLPLLQTRIVALTEDVAAALRRGHIGEAEREHLLLEATLVDEQIEGIRHSQQTVIEYNAAVQPELTPVHQRFADSMKSYQSSVKAALDQADADPSYIEKAGRQASVEVVAFYEQSSSLLTKLLAKRVSGFVLQRTLTTAGVVLLIAVSITLTFLLIGSIVNPLGILRRRMDEIADGAGDLSSRLAEDLPDADLSRLSASFNRFLVRIRDIVTEARRLAARQAGSAHDLKETSEEFGHNMQAEAAGMEEISASMEEISTSAEKVAGSIAGTVRTADDLMQNMERLSTILAKTTTLIGQTSSLTDSTVLRAKDGQTGMQSILDNIADIQQSSKLIDDILAIIEEVADRINLLSLNAAIEAARAGDAGRGFAVVAQEVSRLAEQTNRSTTDIGNLIKENTTRIERGSETIRATVAAINAVIESVGLISRQVLEIAALIPEEDRIRQEVHASTDELKAKAAHIQHSSEEQKSAIDEVTKAIAGINEAVQHSALHSAHVLDRAVDVDADAEQMTALVKKFRT